MKCEICLNEYEGSFCEVCGWEEMNILDSEYLKIFNKRKEIYKNKINKNNDEKFNNFLEKLIDVNNEYLKKDINLAEVFINDICDILKNIDEHYYIEFLLAKFYIYYVKNGKKDKNILQKLRDLYPIMEEEQKEKFNKLKALNDR